MCLLLMQRTVHAFCFFFFNDTATTEIYPLSLHDALPISHPLRAPRCDLGPEQRAGAVGQAVAHRLRREAEPDRKSTRLNSSHSQISYAVFCLKKKNMTNSYASILIYYTLSDYITHIHLTA